MNPLPNKKYVTILSGLKEKIRQARTKAVIAANVEMLQLYWEIGNTIIQQQKTEGWGSKVTKRLAQDLRSEFPDMKGLSERNLVYMQTFASGYPHFSIHHGTTLNTQKADNDFTQPVVAQIPWTKDNPIRSIVS